MTSRKDIGSGRLQYTCNCGWLDNGHAFTKSKDPYVGADALWRQFPIFCGRKDAYFADFPSTNLPRPKGSIEIPERVRELSLCDGKPRFPNGQTGFVVKYAQHMGISKLKRTVVGTYLVRHNLSEDQYKSIALAIFVGISMEFETVQQSEFPFSLISNSGFSQEDLVSNLIGFYVAVGEMTREEAIALCKPVSTETAHHVWDRDGPVGNNKNKKFEPILSKSTFMNSGMQCGDECMHEPKTFPREFQRICPAAYGKNYMRFSVDLR